MNGAALPHAAQASAVRSSRWVAGECIHVEEGASGAVFTGCVGAALGAPAEAWRIAEGMPGLARDELADVVVFRAAAAGRATAAQLAGFAEQLGGVRARLRLLTAAERTPGASAAARLAALCAQARERPADSLVLRQQPCDTEARMFLNRVNEILFDARMQLPPSEEAAGFVRLAGLLGEGLDASPAGRIAANAVDIQREIVLTRTSLPHSWRLAHHDAHVHRLFIDGDGRESGLGRYHFENEPGYMAGCLRSFRLVMAGLGEKLDAGLLCRIHDVAVQHAFKRASVPLSQRFELGYRSGSVAFPLWMGRNCSEGGLAGFEARRARVADWIRVVPPAGGAPGELVALARTPEDCARKAQELLDAHEARLDALCARAAGEDRILEAIAECCQDLNQHHLFAEANIRTIGYLLLNKLLLEQGLAPCILDYPKVLDMMSPGEIVDFIRRGQSRFRALRAAPAALAQQERE